MAFVGSAKNSGTGSGGLTVDNPGVEAGDVMIVACLYDTDNLPIVTDPGWQLILDYYMIGPDHSEYRFFCKIATDDEPDSYLFYYAPFSYNSIMLGAWRGRAITDPLDVLANYSKDHNTDGVDFPFSATAPSLTALAGDDLAFFIGIDNVTLEEVFFSDPSDFTLAESEGLQDYAPSAIWYRDSVGAGSTGAVTSIVNSSESYAGWSAVLFSLPAASVDVRALILTSGVVHQISDAQIGTGLKPLVSYNGGIQQRAISEGTPVVLDAGVLRDIQSGETLLI